MILHACFVIILVATLSISATYRYRARRRNPGLTRMSEAPWVMALRLLCSLPLILTLLICCFTPALLNWAALPWPQWSRWLGVGVVSM